MKNISLKVLHYLFYNLIDISFTHLIVFKAIKQKEMNSSHKPLIKKVRACKNMLIAFFIA